MTEVEEIHEAMEKAFRSGNASIIVTCAGACLAFVEARLAECDTTKAGSTGQGLWPRYVPELTDLIRDIEEWAGGRE